MVRHVHARCHPNEATVAGASTRVALGRIGGKLIAHPQAPVHLALASVAGIVEQAGRGGAEVASIRTEDEIDATVLIAGCDPAAALLIECLSRRRSPVSLVALGCSSGKALEDLLGGRAHVAGVHLRDPKSGDFNSGAAVRGIKRQPAMLVNFARWELGIATAPGNPLKLAGFADLERPRSWASLIVSRFGCARCAGRCDRRDSGCANPRSRVTRASLRGILKSRPRSRRDRRTSA